MLNTVHHTKTLREKLELDPAETRYVQTVDAELSTAHQVTVSTKGSIVIPAALRRRYGLVTGAMIDIEDRGGELVLSVRLAYKEGHGMLFEDR
jgi:AbrB family looped-hinge helix DNA binding protein